VEVETLQSRLWDVFPYLMGGGLGSGWLPERLKCQPTGLLIVQRFQLWAGNLRPCAAAYVRERLLAWALHQCALARHQGQGAEASSHSPQRSNQRW
jgi:hypothetical protein